MLLLVYTLFCDMPYGSWSVFCLKSLCEPFWILIYITVFYSLAPPTKRDNNINNVAKRYSQNVWELFVKPQRVFTILWKNFFNFLKNISTMDETPLKSDLISAIVRLFILIFFVFAFQVSGNYLFFQSWFVVFWRPLPFSGSIVQSSSKTR